MRLTLHSAGPAVSVQDLGRPGFRAQGLTVGGAADPTAIYEGAALLGQSPTLAAIEMIGMGGTFSAEHDLRIALSGAEMSATIDDTPVVWNASHLLPARAKLNIGGVRSGTYGYLSVGGGVDTPLQMGSRASHMSTGIGDALQAGDQLPLGPDRGSETGFVLPRDDRFTGGDICIVSSMQTEAFDADSIARFCATTFKRDPRANRMGVRMDHSGAGFFAQDQLSIVSEVIVPGDIQVSGDGAPYVLMCECQTTGGYPRIGTVLPCDLPKVAQAQAGETLTFRFLDLPEAAAVQAAHNSVLQSLTARRSRLIRKPADIRGLLAYQLISGVTSATSDPFKMEH